MKNVCSVGAVLLALGLAACQTAGEPRDESGAVVVEQLPELVVASFSGFGPEPESEAGTRLMAWLDAHPEYAKDKRVFGHNIAPDGSQENSSQARGYKFMVTLPAAIQLADAQVETIGPGRFAVALVQGNFATDPDWVSAAWTGFNAAIARQKLSIKADARWFEEELPCPQAGDSRLKLYLEVD